MDECGKRRVLARGNVEIAINGVEVGAAKALGQSDSVIAFSCDAETSIGDIVTARFETGQSIEGRIVRRFDKGFAIRFATSEPMIVAGETPLPEDESAPAGAVTERREAIRVPCWRLETTAETTEGAVPCRVRDVSLSGAFIETTATLRVGDRVVINNTPGAVVRASNGAFGVEFDAVRGPTLDNSSSDDGDRRAPQTTARPARLSFGFSRPAWGKRAS
ncbi:MAG: hypothetical protein GC152_00360 [Alphaproteobacteria bacterium]|nr:hypothetical protein [Alphaproteobacteria bacterium]